MSISSEIPSEKYSCSLSDDMLTKGNTAMEAEGIFSTVCSVVDGVEGVEGVEVEVAEVSRVRRSYVILAIIKIIAPNNNKINFSIG